MNTTTNKPNVAALIALLIPFGIWIANRFFHAGLTTEDANIINGGLGAIATWAGVYFVNNREA